MSQPFRKYYLQVELVDGLKRVHIAGGGNGDNMGGITECFEGDRTVVVALAVPER